MTSSVRQENFPINPMSYLDLENEYGLFPAAGIGGHASGPHFYWWYRHKDQAEMIYNDLLRTHPQAQRKPFEEKFGPKYSRFINLFRSKISIQSELLRRKEEQDRSIQERVVLVQNHPEVEFAFRPTPAELVDRYHYSLEDAALRDRVVVFFKRDRLRNGRSQVDQWLENRQRVAEDIRRNEAAEPAHPEATPSMVQQTSVTAKINKRFWDKILNSLRGCFSWIFCRRK